MNTILKYDQIIKGLHFRKLLFFFLLIFCFSAYGQEKHHVVEEDYQNTEVEMADKFRADGKIYVVVAAASIILGGLFFYAFSLDRKITKLEREAGLQDISKKTY